MRGRRPPPPLLLMQNESTVEAWRNLLVKSANLLDCQFHFRCGANVFVEDACRI
eukprot:SAG11_NODE_58_length_19205_cov_30.697315_16_plen_54_part_00